MSLVSIITPTKNRRTLLCSTLDSVSEQDFKSWEHIIVDDGSTDGTEEEVTRRAMLDPRIRYVKRTSTRSGANVCRNLGVRESRGDLIIFLDSDDLLSPYCLSNRVEALLRNPGLDFAVFPGWVFSEKLGDLGTRLFSPRTIGNDLDRFLYLDHPWEITGPIWRRTALERLGCFADHLPSWQDVDLHIRALIAGMKYQKSQTPDHHIRWQNDPTRTSQKQFRVPEHLQSGIGIVKDFERRLLDAGLITSVRRRALAGLIFLLAERWVAGGYFRRGLRVWFHALSMRLASPQLCCFGILVLLIYRLKIFKPAYNERLLERFKCLVHFREQLA